MSNPSFWQALIFSGSAIGLVAGSAWWLYRSPSSASGRKLPQPSGIHIGVVTGFLGLAGLLFVGGGLWDASQHVLTGEVPGSSDFLWPPHIMIYSGFLITLLIALTTLRAIALPARRAGINDPRQWVRSNPYLGAVALASLYGVLSIPGDAIWHALFGVDLTAWSPPHVLLALMTAVVMLSAAALLARSPAALSPNWTRFGVAALLALGLNVLHMVGVLEWELPVRLSDTVISNPIWLYPVVGGGVTFVILMIARHLLEYRWAATLTGVLFFVIRGIITIALSLSDGIVPYLPLVFIVGAFALDWLPWQKITSPVMRSVSIVAAFTIGYIGVALPVLDGRPDLPVFTVSDSWIAGIVTFVLCLCLLPVAQWAAAHLAESGLAR